MTGLGRTSLSLFGTIAVISAVLATATIWLVLSDPVTVANAVNEGDVSPLVRELATAVYEALKGLLKYLVAGGLQLAAVGGSAPHPGQEDPLPASGCQPPADRYRFLTRNFVSTNPSRYLKGASPVV